MKIESFELINRGYGGITVVGMEAIEKDRATIFVDVKKKYPVPLSQELLFNIAKLKKYYLEMTNYWRPSFSALKVVDGRLIDETGRVDASAMTEALTIWENSRLNKVYRKKNGYVLCGTMTNMITDRQFALNTPLIDPEDGYENFTKLQTGVEFCFTMVSDFIADKTFRLSNSRQLALEFYGESSAELERVDALPDSEVENIMIRNLESRGHLVVKMEEMIPEKTPLPENDIDQQVYESSIEEEILTDSVDLPDEPATFENGKKSIKKPLKERPHGSPASK